MEEARDLNRLKVILAEKKKTNKWLAEQLGCARLQSQNGVPILHNHHWNL